MESIIDEYGKAMVAVVVCMSLLAILFLGEYSGKVGIMQGIGTYAEKIADSEDLSDSEVMSSAARDQIQLAKTRSLPAISSKCLKINREYKLDEIITAVDEDGNAEDVEIFSITEYGKDENETNAGKTENAKEGKDANINTTKAVFVGDDGKISFLQAGVYRAHVGVCDALGASENAYVYLRVEK